MIKGLLSIVIVSWNVKDELINCLKSIFEQQGLTFEVIVVDNASIDSTAEVLHRIFPSVKIIANTTNLGFPKANNQGIKISNGEFILLLNPDTIVLPGVLCSCIETMQNKPDVGALGCRLVLSDGAVQYECGRRFLTLWDLICQGFYLHLLFPQSRIFNGHLMGEWDHTGERDVDCVSGAFMMFRKSVLDQIGLLYEMMYLEDMEIAYRIKKAGWHVWYLGTQTVIHLTGRSRSKSQDSLSMLDGEVKYKILQLMYGKWIGELGRLIIGIRSLFRLFLGLFLYLPLRVLQKGDRNLNIINFKHHFRVLQWSIFPKSVSKYLPSYVLPSASDPIKY